MSPGGLGAGLGGRRGDDEAGERARRGAARNVDGWYDGRIDHATFTSRQHAVWDAIRAAGENIERSVLCVATADRGARGVDPKTYASALL